MPICPQCSLGLPATLATCPDCGRHVVEVARAEDVAEPESSPDAPAGPADLFEEIQASDALDEPREENVIQDVSIDVAVEQDEISLEAEEPLAAIEDLEPEIVDEVADLEEEDEETATAEPSLVEPSLEEEEDGELDDSLEQFLAGAKHFAKIVEEPIQAAPPRDPSEPRPKPVRWTHRAYRGDIDVINAQSSRGATLAVFGDGLLIIGSAIRAPGAMAGLVPALSGRRSTRRTFSSAGSSAEAAARLEESRHLAVAKIQSVTVAKGRTWARELTVRTTDGEELRYRFASKRYGQAVALLSPVLGPKLRDTTKAKKTSRRAG